MMILFVWGKETLPTEDVTKGFTASAIAKNIGFQDGDQILSVDGKPLEYVMDVNRHFIFKKPKDRRSASCKRGERNHCYPRKLWDKHV